MDRLAVAERWTAAMSKPGATQLKALAEVVVDDISVGPADGRDAVLEWIKTWAGKSLFRTGSWEPPVVSGEEVSVTCTFDAKAAYYTGTLLLTIPSSGLITKASVLVNAAPEPLGSVIRRVWGPRRRLDHLPAHLSATYGVDAAKVTPLDNGVLRVDHQGGPWVVRVFPADRPLAEVKGDAAVLRFLESKGYPAERCVADVSTFEGQGVLVTAFVAGKKPAESLRTATEMADLLGRLHAMKGGPAAARRASGGLHLYSADTSVQSEIDTAHASLVAAAFRGTDKRYAPLLDALTEADDFSDLPAALTHPDFHFKNTVASPDGLVPIDWAGAGRGPRVLALAMLLFYGSLKPGGWDPKRVDAMMRAYGEHVVPTAAELERLSEAMQHRMLIHEAYAWSVGMATQRKPGTGKEWPANIGMCEEIASRAAAAV